MSMTVVTYGGGEILHRIFDAVAMLIHGKGGVFRPLIVISVSCGTVWAVSKAFFTSQAEAFLSRFFLPLVAVLGLFSLPSTSVRVEDKLTNRSYSIDHVPWVLAKVSETVSTIGDAITRAFETVMHVSNDTSYNATGMIFGAETALDISRYKISNAALEQNLKRFSKQCIFYDLALGKYGINDLKKATDLWNFLETQSSKVRMIPYTNPSEPKAKMVYLTCQKALQEMRPYFEKERHYHAAQDLVKHLPLTYQALTGLRKSQEELIGQQLMMHVISDELDSQAFAKGRAHAQQKSTYLVLGSLASSSLITMRAVLEALIYAAFIFVIPLSVLPGGFSFLSNWLWLTIWLQLWPPFFAIINYVMQTVAKAKSAAIFQGLEEFDKGLSFLTSSGLSHLYEDLYALSGYLAASIPFISWAIIKGGASSFIHLASSMMTPAHAAATSAAGEQASGSYNLASSSFGQMSYANATGFQRSLAPALSSGYFSENQGNLSTIYSGGEAILRQANSELRWGLSSDDSVVQSFQTSQQSADQFVKTSQQHYTESLSAHGRSMSDLSHHLAQSQNYSEGLSQREAYDIQESARFLENKASSLAEQYGITNRESMALLCSTKQLTAALHLIPGAALVDSLLPAGTYDRGTSSEAMANTALNTVNSEEFQLHYQKVFDYSQSQVHTQLTDEGARLVSGATQSLDEIRTAQEQYQVAKSHSEQTSELASWATQNAYVVRAALNQHMVNWATEKLGFEEAKQVLTSENQEEMGPLIHEFVQSFKASHGHQVPSGHFQNPTDAYDTAQVPSLNRQKELHRIHQHHPQDLAGYGLQSNDLSEKAKELRFMAENAEEAVDGRLHHSKAQVNQLRQGLQQNLSHKHQEIEETHEMLMVGRLWQGPIGQIDLSSQYSGDELPLGFKP